jgi:hypothetical protein
MASKTSATSLNIAYVATRILHPAALLGAVRVKNVRYQIEG